MTCIVFSGNFRSLAILAVLIGVFIYVIYTMNQHTGLLLKLVDGLANDSQLREFHSQARNDSRCAGYGKNISQYSRNSCIKRLPNCLIIGVEKAGTYALLKFLSAHPQVERNTAYDELYFFDRYYNKGLKWYKNKMPYSLPGQIVLEKTPSYFIRMEVPARVFRMSPDIHLLLTVRSPVQRAISAYAMEKERHHGFLKDFENFVLYPSGVFDPNSPFIQHSLYDFYLQRWLRYFNLSQIHIVDGDKFSTNPLTELKGIERFLNIESYFNSDMFVYNATKGFYCLKTAKSVQQRETTDCLKETKGRKHPNISSVVIKKMRSYFRPHNLRFYNTTGMHFKWDF